MFSFKQFTVRQQKCAMKVCTDSCLFGAWVAEKTSQALQTREILDIGTGTGLLSLMLAQKISGHVDAIEINNDAALQAAENFFASPWKERLTVLNADIRAFDFTKKYDLIISNPPFFESDLRSGNAGKNAAKHDTTLLLDDLVTIISNNIKAEGTAALLIPWHRTAYVEDLLRQNKFHVCHKAEVRQTPAHGYFRTMLLFSKKEGIVENEEIIIHNNERKYTPAFVELLGDYYLNLTGFTNLGGFK